MPIRSLISAAFILAIWIHGTPTLAAVDAPLTATVQALATAACGAVITAPTGSPVKATVGQGLTFTAGSTGGNSFRWEFGDGSTTTGQNAGHAYNATGTYQVLLTVTSTNTTYSASTATLTVVVTLPAPSISSFTASATPLKVGGSTTLTWATTDATSVTLNGGTVAASDSRTFTLSSTTTYTLVAKNSTGTVSKAVTVTVVPLPTITSFTATPSVVTAGGSSVLLAVFPAGTGAIPALGAVTSGTGKTLTFPSVGTSTFTLTVTDSMGQTSTKSVTITVVAAPTAAMTGPVAITTGDSATLTGTFSGGTGAITGVGAVTSGSGVVVQPTQDTTYTLTVTNAAGTKATTTWTIQVYPVPTASISPAIKTITLGDSIVLTPTFTGGTATISGIGSVVSGTPVTVMPNLTTTYTLNVTNWANRTVSAASSVTVAGSPTISSFVADKTKVTTGQGTVLRFTFTNGTAVVYKGTPASGTLLTGIPASGGSGTQSITVDASSRYTLQVTNAAGVALTRILDITAVAPAVISSFVATRTTISVGSSSSLTGFFSGGTGAVSPTVGTVTTNGSSSVAPTATTIYTLSVTNDAGDAVTAQVTVTVVDMPAIQGFTADSLTLRPGKPAVLTSTFTGGTGVIDPTVGVVVSGQAATVTPGLGKTTYTLTVSNAAGDAVSASLTLNSNLTLKWVKDIVYVGGKEVAEMDATGMHITLTDHLGSPRLMVNGDGVLEAEQKFTPFGEMLSTSSKFAKGFTNHEQTDASGLVYMQARFYLPMWGRFASPDPARDQHFEDTQSWNIYSYCMNNPVMKVDPSGMLWQELKNWWTGGGWNKNAEAEKVRMVRQVDWSSAEGRKLGVKPGNSAGLNKSGQVVRTWNSEGIHDDSGSLLLLAGGANLAKNLVKAGAEVLTKEAGGVAEDLVAAASKPFNDTGLSQAARAIEKHAGRAGSSFETLTGDVAQKNAVAEGFVRDVLSNPNTVRTELSRGGVEFRLPSGQGVRYNSDGSFSGVLDPQN